MLIWVLAGLVAVTVGLLARSRTGRALNALREDATAASCMGVNVRRYRVIAALIAAAIAGLAAPPSRRGRARCSRRISP